MTAPEETNSKKLNKDILLVTYIFMGLFLLLAVYFFYLVGYSGRELINNPYNKLQNLLSNSVVRGNIYSSDGELWPPHPMIIRERNTDTIPLKNSIVM